MNQADFFYKKQTLTAEYGETPLEFGFAGSIKLKVTGGNVDFSFDGSESHGELVDADGFLTFDKANKSKVFVKGTGSVQVWAWIGG